jgi:hypothetical protein
MHPNQQVEYRGDDSIQRWGTMIEESVGALAAVCWQPQYDMPGPTAPQPERGSAW